MPHLISSIQLLHSIIEESVVAVGIVWVTAAEGRGWGDEVREMGEADNEGLEGHLGTLAFTLSTVESPWWL